MTENKVIDTPSIDSERQLQSVIANQDDIAVLRGKKVRIGWLRYISREKITDILLNEKNENKVNVKCAAVIMLNNFWLIHLFYWVVWRWMYYVKEYTEDELTDVLALGKKKVPQESYWMNTILLTDLRLTMMTMTRAEVNRIRQESIGVQRGQSEKNIPD